MWVADLNQATFKRVPTELRNWTLLHVRIDRICIVGTQRIRNKRMLSVSKDEVLVLLLVVEAHDDTPQRFLVSGTPEEFLHLCVDVRAKAQNLIERRAGKRSAQRLFRNLLTERVVITVEQPAELLAKGLVVREKRSQHESFEEPCRVGLVPFHRTCLGTRLHHLILG